MKHLYTVVKNEWKDYDNNKIFILKQNELDNAMGIMHELTISEEMFGIRDIIIGNGYKWEDKVVRYWHEDGLCIIIK